MCECSCRLNSIKMTGNWQKMFRPKEKIRLKRV
jgi:hypothetical protein